MISAQCSVLSTGLVASGLPALSQRSSPGGGGVSAKGEVMPFCLKLATSKKGGGFYPFCAQLKFSKTCRGG